MPFDGIPTKVTALCEVRDRLAAPGAWHQGDRDGPDGAHCIMGWVIDVIGGWPSVALCSQLHEVARSEGWRHVIEFNDSPNTTQADVLAFIDRAIVAQSGK